MDLDLQPVTDGLRFPEGPVAMADGSVIPVEIAARRITRVAPDGAKTPPGRARRQGRWSSTDG